MMLLRHLTTGEGLMWELSGPLILMAIFYDWIRKIATFGFLSALFADVQSHFLISSLTSRRQYSQNTPYNPSTQRHAGT
jgi:hypothetical protein